MFEKAPEHVMKTITKEDNILGEDLTLNIDYRGIELTVKRHSEMGHLNGYINVPTNITAENITPYIEAIYVDKMNVIVVEYTFYNEEGIRMLGQYPIGEVM